MKVATRKDATLDLILTNMHEHVRPIQLVSCEEIWHTSSDVVSTGLDILMPGKQYGVCTADAPWMTRKVKSLILKRQKAFNTHGPESVQFKFFRNLVNRERKDCRGWYYESKVQQLEGENPKNWWDEVMRLSGPAPYQSKLKPSTRPFLNRWTRTDYRSRLCASPWRMSPSS